MELNSASNMYLFTSIDLKSKGRNVPWLNTHVSHQNVNVCLLNYLFIKENKSIKYICRSSNIYAILNFCIVAHTFKIYSAVMTYQNFNFLREYSCYNSILEKKKKKTDNVKEKVKKSIEILVNENLATLMTKLVNENLGLLKLMLHLFRCKIFYIHEKNFTSKHFQEIFL